MAVRMREVLARPWVGFVFALLKFALFSPAIELSSIYFSLLTVFHDIFQRSRIGKIFARLHLAIVITSSSYISTEIHSQNDSDEKIGQLLVKANQRCERWAFIGEKKNICIDRSRRLIVHFIWWIANERVSTANEWVCDSSQLLNKYRTHSPTMK